MKNHQVISIGLLLLSLWSCKETKDSFIDSKLSLVRNEIELTHDSLLLKRVDKSSIVGRDSLLVFDNERRTFVLFDLTNKKPLWHFEAQITGPDFLNTPVFDMFLRKDGLYVLDRSYISVFDINSAKVKQRISSDEITNWNENFLIFSFEEGPDQSIYLPITDHAGVFPGLLAKKNNSIIYTYSKNGKLDSLPVSAPEESLLYDAERGYYNNFAAHHLNQIGELTIFNYEFSSTIYVYNNKTQQISAKNIEPKLSPSKRDPLSKEYIRNNIGGNPYEGPRFFPVHYLPEIDIYLRYHSFYEKTTDGSALKKRYMMFFDAEFNVIDEIDISDEDVWEPIVDGNKLYFRKVNQEFEDRFQYVVYTIEKVLG
ncbi:MULTISPECIES: hypothetical protein [Roseivirga]|uniref:hypothetical protein n=1 Tax=Roseivirga TaxID=290180 RepID=UPI00257CD904|nr:MULTISPECIES: hypothetical protein [Roseivirga]MEC7752796.1 hypothetical protein [Bacteroidota bacterium]|tara:strand:+ start:2501 stop:3607 length:1107 start_codon:yes stop_codon:yes gene_type:complete